MPLQTLYNEYINIKWKRSRTPAHTEPFEYGIYEDGSADLFLTDSSEETFTNWMSQLQPKDPYYGAKPNGKPVLTDVFNQLDMYDELTLYYLLFTINTTMSINTYNCYSDMNDFMKSYSFFQLSQLSEAIRLNDEQKQQLRDIFYFFYLYAHPVNEETLYACSFTENRLIYTQKAISLDRYFSAFHDHYCENRELYSEHIVITPHEIQVCKHLTLELLAVIEGRSPKLSMPSEKGLESVVALISDVDQMLEMYEGDRIALFNIMGDFLAEDGSNLYRDHCFTTLLQNYALYILYFNFDELHTLVDHFKVTPLWCEIIINKMFTDTIFMRWFMKRKDIDITTYPDVIQFFNEEASKMYL
ncbi:hypothetical protein [Paenibacillus sp. FSL H8-0079]|uniref:hypothetical protein n=1 Tax=Paenibacillus sp. FSL H8-0079 TaxID=2921375 RepID=UPI0030EED97F